MEFSQRSEFIDKRFHEFSKMRGLNKPRNTKKPGWSLICPEPVTHQTHTSEDVESDASSVSSSGSAGRGRRQFLRNRMGRGNRVRHFPDFVESRNDTSGYSSDTWSEGNKQTVTNQNRNCGTAKQFEQQKSSQPRLVRNQTFISEDFESSAGSTGRGRNQFMKPRMGRGRARHIPSVVEAPKDWSGYSSDTSSQENMQTVTNHNRKWSTSEQVVQQKSSQSGPIRPHTSTSKDFESDTLLVSSAASAGRDFDQFLRLRMGPRSQLHHMTGLVESRSNISGYSFDTRSEENKQNVANHNRSWRKSNQVVQQKSYQHGSGRCQTSTSEKFESNTSSVSSAGRDFDEYLRLRMGRGSRVYYASGLVEADRRSELNKQTVENRNIKWSTSEQVEQQPESEANQLYTIPQRSMKNQAVSSRQSSLPPQIAATNNVQQPETFLTQVRTNMPVTRENKKAQQNQEKTPDKSTPDPRKIIQDILREAEVFGDQVEKFAGYKKNKQYWYLLEMLTQLMMKLDDVNAEGRDSIRQERKRAVKNIKSCISRLEQTVS